MQLKRIDNSDILCKDIAKMADFYHETLGLPFFLPYEPAQGWAAVDAGNVTFFIFQTPTGKHEPPRSTDNLKSPPGLDSFAFEVEDLDEAIAELTRRGVNWAGEVTRWNHPSGTWYRYRAFYDPEFNMLYVTEPHKV